RRGDPRAGGLCGDRGEGQSRDRVERGRTTDDRGRIGGGHRFRPPSSVLSRPSEAMIDIGYVQSMARYNRWQNANLYGVADTLSEAERRRERGAFFGSIFATLNHLLWADRIWMSRLAGTPQPTGGIPESVSLYSECAVLHRE